jgi:glucose-1-phosphate cytidylyltransferase
MKSVVLAGGFGTRLSEETHLRPKPMVEIGGRPILWHVLKTYAHHGITEFVICLGYKGHMVKEYFTNYLFHEADITVDLGSGEIEVHNRPAEPWKVTLVDTGLHTMTGGRLKRIAPFLDDTFCMTYGDGLSDVDIRATIEHHASSGRLATVTAVPAPARFGALDVADGQVTRFREKPSVGGNLINGGFFVLSPEVLDYIDGDETVWEREPMERLAQEGQLGAWEHPGFWQPMDTLRDRKRLEELWATGDAPWKVWS